MSVTVTVSNQRGPQGDAGSDAEVTANNVQAALAADPEGAKTTLGIPLIDVTDYGAVPDGMRSDTGVVSGVNVTVAGTNFASRVGDFVRIEGAGAAGADHVSTIATGANGSFTLTDTAPTPIASNAVLFFGTDNTAAIQAALDAASESTTTRTVYVPPGIYLGNFIVRRGTRFLGAYRGSVLQELPTVGHLGTPDLVGTVLMPATRDLPVIYSDKDTGTSFGVGIEGFLVAGSLDKEGYGIKVGFGWDAPSGGASYTLGRTEIVRCDVAGFETAISFSSGCQGDIAFCSWNDSTIGLEVWSHDGLTIRNCDCANVGIGFRFGGGNKNIWIQSGNYNLMDVCVDMTDTHLLVGTINVEHCEDEVFALRKDGADCSLVVDYVKILGGSGIVVRNYFPEAYKDECQVRIREGSGNTLYYDTANSAIPQEVTAHNIRRYADNTFAVLSTSDKTRRVIPEAGDNRLVTTIRDEFIGNLSASPYSDFGWTLTNVSGTYTCGPTSAPRAPGMVRIGSSSTTSTNEGRFATNATFLPGNQNIWQIRMVLSHEYISTAIFRAGLYSLDSAVKPQAGVGIRVDTTAGTPDTNIQLEIISGGTSVGVVDTGVALGNLTTAREIILNRTSDGVTCVIKDTSGVALAPQVVYATALPSWATYHGLAFYTGSSSTQWQAFNVASVEYTQYPSTGF